jgi:hypothetical protein
LIRGDVLVTEKHIFSVLDVADQVYFLLTYCDFWQQAVIINWCLTIKTLSVTASSLFTFQLPCLSPSQMFRISDSFDLIFSCLNDSFRIQLKFFIKVIDHTVFIVNINSRLESPLF